MKDNDKTSRTSKKYFGEVFTPRQVVNGMIKTIPQEICNNIESTWLEPSCGDGNFLVVILEMKLERATELDRSDYDINILKVIASIYGIELQKKNTENTRKRMLQIMINKYKKHKGEELSENLKRAIEFMINRNIVWGDFLTGKDNETNDDIMISEWKFKGLEVSREEYTLQSCLKSNALYKQPVNTYAFTSYNNIEEQEAIEDDVMCF